MSDDLSDLPNEPVSRPKTSRNVRQLVNGLMAVGPWISDDDEAAPPTADPNPPPKAPQMTQWAIKGSGKYGGTANTTKKVPPGFYNGGYDQPAGFYLQKTPIEIDNLLRLPDSACDSVVAEVQNFWSKEEKFKLHKVKFKRGILLHGPPGGGKSCTVQLAIADIIKRGGIAINFTEPGLFINIYRVFREIEPVTPVVVILEDLDSIIEEHSESSVLNILDGAESVSHALYMATTNYPEKLGGRIVNRPSRFDRRYKIGFPTDASRRVYLEHLSGGKVEIDLDKWVKDSIGMGLAHLKELFVATVVLEKPYNETLKALKAMREKVSSESEGGKLGFSLE